MLGLQVLGAMGVPLGRGAVLGMVYLHTTAQALIDPLLDTNNPLALAGNPSLPTGSSRPMQLCQGSSDPDGSQPPSSLCHLCATSAAPLLYTHTSHAHTSLHHHILLDAHPMSFFGPLPGPSCTHQEGQIPWRAWRAPGCCRNQLCKAGFKPGQSPAEQQMIELLQPPHPCQE